MTQKSLAHRAGQVIAFTLVVVILILTLAALIGLLVWAVLDVWSAVLS